MTIQEFFEKSCGKWFSQRTTQHLTYNQSEWGKSDVYIDMLAVDDSTVMDVCEKHGVDPGHALCAVQVKWEGFVGADPSKQMGRTILVPLQSEIPHEGTLLRQTVKPASLLSTARYVLDGDSALSLFSDYEGVQTQERLWFVSDNLRLRTSMVKRPGQFDTSSFVSEIRVIGS